MPDGEPPAFPTFVEDRGILIPMELADVPFPVTRVFYVRGPVGGAERGGHRVDGRELIVLLHGEVTLTLGGDRERTVELTEPGSRVQLEDRTQLSYVMHGADSEILVFCDRTFNPKDGE